MTDWVRLWHDMPTDPKWRVIARKSGQPIPMVISVYAFLMVNASCNAMKRGVTQGFVAEDVASALDVSEQEIDAVITAMEGKVLTRDGNEWLLTGWEKRQPKREDSSTNRVKEWRVKRNETQRNAKKRPDAETDTDKSTLTPRASNWDLACRVLKCIGADPDDQKWFGLAARIEMWIARGWSLDQHIVPALSKMAAKRQAKSQGPPDNFHYLERVISSFVDDIERPLPEAKNGTRNGHHRPAKPTGEDRVRAIFGADALRGEPIDITPGG